MKLSLLFEELGVEDPTDAPEELEDSDALEKVKERMKVGQRYTQPRNAEAV